MNILITGATGFIGSQIVTDLLKAGHQVTCCVRNVDYAKRIFPTARVIACNFIQDTDPKKWVARLNKIDIVINCVGILYHPRKKITWTIHDKTPRALFDAAVKVGVKKIIQLSALGVDQSAVEYSKSKKAADDYLQTLPIDSVILRPSLVYGRGSYGGTSLFRGLAGLPFILPVPGKGTQTFQPIHVQDLSQAIVKLIKSPPLKIKILNAVSKKRVNLKEILMTTRAWLGFSKARLLSIPLFWIGLLSRFGDFTPYSVTNSTSYKMLSKNSVATDTETNRFHEHIGFTPRDFNEGIYSEPSTVQDRWHARLYFLKPLLQGSIAFVFLFTALASLFLYPKNEAYALLAQTGVYSSWQPILFYSASLLNGLLGLALLLNYKTKLTALLQITLILIYSLIITWRLPSLWLDPFQPIAKNIPLIVAILIYLALEADR